MRLIFTANHIDSLLGRFLTTILLWLAPEQSGTDGGTTTLTRLHFGVAPIVDADVVTGGCSEQRFTRPRYRSPPPTALLRYFSFFFTIVLGFVVVRSYHED